MKNEEIIIKEAIAHGIFTEEEVQAYQERGLMVPLHTYRHWQELGFQVEKGQHAVLTTRLWQRKGKNTDREPSFDLEVDGEKKNGFFLAKAHLFTLDQVSRAIASE